RIELSDTKSVTIVKLLAPSDFISPISLRLSNTVVAIDAETASAAAPNAANVTSNIKPEMCESSAPSFCDTFLICSTREFGITPRIWYAMEFAYGEHDQRSNTAGDIDAGSRRAKSSSGLVRALT